jgi:glycosyltransferase involved in cell wall biosynthesis
LPKAVIIGPLPPPYHGMSIFTRQILGSELLKGSYELLHVDTADRRTAENMGRFDLTNVALALRHAGELLGVLVRERPEVVYVEVSQNTWAYLRDAVFIVLGRALGSRVVAHLHGSYFRTFYQEASPWCRWLVHSTSRLLAAAAVLGPGLTGMYEGLVAVDRIHSVPNGVPDPFPEGVRRAPREGVPVTVLYLGMLFEPKGFLDLLRAAAEFEASEVRFIFAGEWFSEREKSEAARLIAELRLEGRVTFPGRVDGEEKRALFEGADLLVFPGYQPEGMPLVILEAMAASLPVISTDTGATRDMVVHGETGLIVGKQDPAAIAAAVRRLVEDEALRMQMGRAGRARYLEEFTEERCARRLVALFDAARGKD